MYSITKQKVTISLLDLFGKEIKQVFSNKNISKGLKIKSDITFLNPGVYFYKIEVGNEVFVHRIIKK